MELSAAELWTRVLDSARANLPDQSFRTWLSGSRALALSEDELQVEAPSQFHVEWIEDKYGSTLGEITAHILGRPLRLSFRSSRPGTLSPLPSVEVLPSAAAEGSERSGASPATPEPAPSVRPGRSGNPGPRASAGGPGHSLNERYTFDRFVVGNDSQFAAAACRAVAEKPALAYNPLFLYGGVGLGKTHLMHAIGNHILAGDPTKRVAYVPSEQFMNELVTSIQEVTTAEFRRRYRQMDLLLVDDVHFFEKKERTQEEFFHTFNALYDAQKQIVLTSDRPPKEIPGLEERLISRFEWGLVADIKLPDYETRVAILRKKAADESLTLDDEVIDYIARACTSSVRELEGAVIKLLAYSSLTNQEMTVGLAKASLEGVIRGGGGSRSGITPERIREVVATRWNVPPEALVSKRRTKDLTVPRQVAMYLIKELLDVSLVQIGDAFGGRDHSTVIHSIRKVDERLAEDPEYRTRIERVREELTGGPRVH
jgi:chromosomal replication initiator protein